MVPLGTVKKENGGGKDDDNEQRTGLSPRPEIFAGPTTLSFTFANTTSSLLVLDANYSYLLS